MPSTNVMVPPLFVGVLAAGVDDERDDDDDDELDELPQALNTMAEASASRTVHAIRLCFLTNPSS